MIRHAVHAYTYKGVHIVYDGISKTLITVNDVGYEIIKRYATHHKSEIINLLVDRFDESDLNEAYGEIESLVEEGALFCDENQLTSSSDWLMPNLHLSGICLHVAHDCNMRCAYCFAGSGLYGGKPTLMSEETARSALDYLFSKAGPNANLYVDFFGGEPTLNFPLVLEAIQYGNRLAEASNRTITWSMTTNGLELNEETIDFLNKHQVNVIVSMDGRPQVHETMRPSRQGKGTYTEIKNNAENLFHSRFPVQTNRYGYGVYTYIRGTFSRNNVDFSEDVFHLYRQGFRHIAMEPVVSEPSLPWTLSAEHVEELKRQYDQLVDFVLESRRRNDPLYFHHFEMDLEAGSCLGKRASGCGAGVSYLAVSPDGEIYPCHQFVGNSEFQMGSVSSDALDSSMQQQFSVANQSGSKVTCQTCFARYHCGGGCHANHWLLNHDLLQPDLLSCELIRKRLECALYLAVSEATDFEPSALDEFAVQM